MEVIKIGFIYKITNKLNGKAYIGKTLGTVEKRFNEHLKDAKRRQYEKRPLYTAINKYGIDNFCVETLEKCDNNIISQREIYWIEYYDTYKNGYNATRGGDGKVYINEDEVIKEYLKNKNATITAKQLNISLGGTLNILKRNDIKIISAADVARNNGSAVYMLDKNNNIIMEFQTTYDAVRYLIDNRLTKCKLTTIRYHISEVCSGKRKSAAGYKWELK